MSGTGRPDTPAPLADTPAASAGVGHSSPFRAHSDLSAPPTLGPDDAHVWRVDLGAPYAVDALRAVLSQAERERAARFYAALHARRYAIVHGMLRHILAGYVGQRADTLRFSTGEHGKPFLRGPEAAARSIAFNLSHSGDLALLAIARGRQVGVDVEQLNDQVDPLALADDFFSPSERAMLHTLDHQPGGNVVRGFFTAWSRKEAYLKATGVGIAQGLHHFDVSLDPDAPARLLADRLDAGAPTRWSMRTVDCGPQWSGALVVESPLREVQWLEAPIILGT